MAVVYKATDIALGRVVAVKILRPSMTSDPMFITRFQNEARAIANLAHPNIVTVHDVGTDVDVHGRKTHYIVMEFVEGQDLKKLIRTQGALNVDQALTFGIQVCAGIGYAHRAGIVHADIKPQNILLTKDQTVKMTDFGIAQALSDTQPQQKESVVWGSPHYFAPEQARGEKPTASADVYSIGIVLFEMLTGRVPYMGQTQQDLAMAHIKERIPSVTEFNPNVPQELALIVQRAMSKEPSDRFRIADQLGQVLSAYRERGNDRTANMAPPPPQTLPQTQPRPQVPPAPVSAPTQAPPPPPAMPTQRYNIAPDAPVPNPGYGARPSQGFQGNPPPVPTPQPLGNLPPYSPPPALRGDSARIEPATGRRVEGREGSAQVFDPITLILAFLAFVAVACLIPLYIVVLNTR
jgi:serine/threonine-protein kinase